MFLSDIFSEKVEDFWYIDKEYKKENRNLRYGLSDIVIENEKERIMIEMQNQDLKNLESRITMYFGNHYSAQNPGKNYENVKPLKVLLVLNYPYGTSKGVQNVSVNEKSSEVSIALNESGTYSIKLTGSDEHNNTNTLNSGEYKIDVTEPVVGSVTPSGTVGSNGWYTSNVTFTVTNGSDTLSEHKSTVVTPSSLTSNTTGTSVTVTTEDNAGNKSTATFGPYKIDKTEPTFTVKSVSSVTVIKGTSNAIQSTYFNTPTWSISGTGSVSCKVGSTAVTNTSSLAVGTHEVICTATGQNGLTKSATKTIIIKAPNVDTTGANKPTLSNGLVPIKWDGSKWIKADSDNGSGTNQWYDYDNQMWANAASVTSSYRNVSVGSEIPESAINAYFVWISRYEYQYTNLGTNYAGGSKTQPGQINVNFIATSKTSPSSIT